MFHAMIAKNAPGDCFDVCLLLFAFGSFLSVSALLLTTPESNEGYYFDIVKVERIQRCLHKMGSLSWSDLSKFPECYNEV